MCGIIGYIGKQNALPFLIDGLERESYRGYDSSGIAVISDTNQPHLIKAVGKLEHGDIITKINDKLKDKPELINQSPYEEGWLFQMECADSKDIDSLLTESDYHKVKESAGHH